MQAPLISCIVPVFNGERYLSETLDSILAQNYRPLEIIVADDGSTDRTANVVTSYCDRVRYLKQENTGPPAARNLGLSAATGEFIAFLDADDLWHPEKLARQIARFDARSELDGCVSHVKNFWSPELIHDATHHRDCFLSMSVPGYLTQSLLARRGVFERVGWFNPGLRHADKTEWFLRAAEKQAVIELLPDALVFRRIHKSNMSREHGEKSREEYLQLLKARIDRHRHIT